MCFRGIGTARGAAQVVSTRFSYYVLRSGVRDLGEQTLVLNGRPLPEQPADAKFKPEYNGFERNVSARHFALHRLQCIPACWVTPQIRRHLGLSDRTQSIGLSSGGRYFSKLARSNLYVDNA